MYLEVFWKTITAGIDIFDEDGTCFGTVGLPKLDSIRSVVGDKEERVAENGQRPWFGAVRARVDVFDEHGTVKRPVGPPQFIPIRSVVRIKEQHAVELRTLSVDC